MQRILPRWFIPHESNNYRAKLLHHSSILGIALVLFFVQFVFTYLRVDHPAVLGSSIDLSTEELVKLTNQERTKQQLQPLELNDTLSKAAALKADYMFANNFWAHNGPDGTTPWYFFKQVGYNYTYAGENLARGFTDSSEVMNAWMNSPTHKENILSSHYKEIGFAVKKGKLLGEDTTLIVELFGSTTEMPVVEKSQEQTYTPQQHILPAAVEKNTIQQNNMYSFVKTTSLLSTRTLSSSIAMFIIGVFILGLFIDMLIVSRKKIIRIVGHNMDHIFFFAAILLVIIFSIKGVVL